MSTSNASLGTPRPWYSFVCQCSQAPLSPELSDLWGTLELVHLFLVFPGENSQVPTVS